MTMGALIFYGWMGASPRPVAGSTLLGPTQRAALSQVLNGAPLSGSVACDQYVVSGLQCQRSLAVSDAGCLPKCPAAASLHLHRVS